MHHCARMTQYACVPTGWVRRECAYVTRVNHAANAAPDHGRAGSVDTCDSMMTLMHEHLELMPSMLVSPREGRCARVGHARGRCSVLVLALDDECISPEHRHVGQARGLLHAVNSLHCCDEGIMLVFLGAVESCTWCRPVCMMVRRAHR